ncbi:response regulator [Jannaschia seohaensis]|uniref:Two-component system response regulator NreC n=1 Tax=Jannaschia seohaensis TaxID=475081 RepID=A0A2Y9AIL7_9RHOB|nr:response regulator transcription factor [Jannaschia seohaensis]PWJ20296.1 two-component system response regulator NreC [Jannaschia seohaensis]SSA44321.1 two-component system, NarL family, response regulator NreC [Jannaschia seohaensis]
MPTSQVRRVVIADDHALVRTGMKNILAGLDDVVVVGEAENGLEAIALAKEQRPDLLLLDAGMPLSRGMEVFGEVRRWTPETRIAVVTGFNAAGSLSDWIAAGVDGLFLKTCPPEEMATGFALLLQGEGYVSKDVLRRIQNAEAVAELSQRERQVLHLIAEGCSNAAIAERLSISAKTVDNHRTRLMAKLGVHSVGQLLAYALKEGLLDSSAQL